MCTGESLGDVGRSRDKTLHGSPGVRQGLTARVVLELRLGAPAQQGPQRAVEDGPPCLEGEMRELRRKE